MLQGNQVTLEGLVADILNEHFGESVELVGIALFRNGQMTFVELVRICNMNFLSMPRDSLNPFSEYTKATFGSDSVAYKTIRDSLLVLIHHGLVTVVTDGSGSTTIYSLNAMEIFNRLLFPMFLEPFEQNVDGEKTAVETLIKKHMMTKNSLIQTCEESNGVSKNNAKETVSSLMGKRVIVSVDSLSTSSPTKSSKSAELVVRLNSAELQLEVIKRYIVEYVAGKYNADYASVIQSLLGTVSSREGGTNFRSRVSIGDLSVADINAKLKMSSNDLISTLIKLQQAGLAARQQAFVEAAKPVGGRKRKSAPVAGRAKNTKQLLSMIEDEDDNDFSELVGESSLPSGAPSYTVRFFEIIEEIESEILFQMVKAQYGTEAARVFELLANTGQKYEASHVADICAIAREDALKYLHAFAQDGLCRMQEVPKVTTSASAASAGVAAMMRAVASSFWLYFVDHEKVRREIISLLSKSIVNLRRRFRFEVNRQCRIEDRATLLTKQEQVYLETVHAAQDTLEGNSVQLVSSLLILLLRSD